MRGFQKGNKINLGRKLSEETKRKLSETNKGHFVLEETKRKISEAQKGRPRVGNPEQWKVSEKTKRNISKTLKGHKTSEETKKKISKAMQGRKHTEETKRKIRQNTPRLEKSPHWKGGKSFEPYSIDWTDDLKELIRKRDDYICQICGTHQDELNGWFKKLDIHHCDYNKDNLDTGNLITLCRKCHIKTNGNRNYWINYFIICHKI